ncbi:MAG: glycosyltransferase [SAR324 cluster bacterium]|nr:glycosyltransferase [SAR324 cluster bacterium]
MPDDILQNKKVALVHDWLNGMRGGEKCLEVFCEIFPDADLYTLLYEEGTLSATIEEMSIIPSFIQKLPYSFKRYRHYLPLFPIAIERFNLNDYDLILSSSHCVAKGVRHHGKPYHISYIHAPMRYMWGLFDTYFGPQKTNLAVRTIAKAIRPYLQQWDLKSSNRVHTFLCNSKNIQNRILEIYHRDSTVIHPPVDLSSFPAGNGKKNFYLMVGAFAPNKRVDLAIKVFNNLKHPLKIVGSGQDEAYCRSIADSNIEFLGNVDDRTISQLYQEAKAFIFPGEDDFGITPLEAQASGTPVIAFAKGGALETVTEETGIFFNEQTVESLETAVVQFEDQKKIFSTEKCVQQARRFSRERFKQEIIKALEQGYQQWQNTEA